MVHPVFTIYLAAGCNGLEQCGLCPPWSSLLPRGVFMRGWVRNYVTVFVGTVKPKLKRVKKTSLPNSRFETHDCKRSGCGKRYFSPGCNGWGDPALFALQRWIIFSFRGSHSKRQSCISLADLLANVKLEESTEDVCSAGACTPTRTYATDSR